MIALLCSAVGVVNYEALYWDSALTLYFGEVGVKNVSTVTFDTDDHAQVANLIVAEGAVLLKNEKNALPMKGGKISLFGIDNKNGVLQKVLEDEGFTVNPTLAAFYAASSHSSGAGSLSAGNGSETGGWVIDEVPQSEYTADVKASYKDYNDAAVVVLMRTGAEGNDLPYDMSRYGGSADENYLELNKDEKELLAEVHKSFDKVIVLISSANAVELDVIEPAVCGEDFGIDACLWVGEVGQSGIRAIGDLLSGKINPSGRLVDTYCYDNTTSPAVQNAYVTSYTNAAEKGLAFAKTNNEYYVVYQEGIYIGYRYYETRYEDAVLGNANVGDYDYAKTVAFPFGYGLNYSNLSYGKLNMKENGDTFDFTVDVTNPSDRDAREAVLIYMQSPYTDYDKQNGIEKAAVELVGYTKIDVPAGKTVTANVSVAKSEMRAYDANGAKTYIVDEGNYYFATGNSAHEALNNILMQKAAQSDTLNGAVDSAKMVGEGRADLAVVYKQAKQDTTTYATSRTGFAITNQLDHGDLNKFDADASNDIKYLTRADWAGTMPKADLSSNTYKAAVQMAANDELVKALNTIIDSEKKGTMPTLGKEGELTLAHFIGVPLDGSITLQNGQTYT